MCRTCHFVPLDVLERLAADPALPPRERQICEDTAKLDTALRKVRLSTARLTRVAQSLAPTMSLANAVAASTPAVTIYDCNHAQTLPGAPIAAPAQSNDKTAVQVFDTTAAVADFYAKVFGRNSIDDAGLTLMSSIHYGLNYNNAFWNGAQMAYGDGDGSIFVDFSNGNDVVAHELTHGVTQHTLQLNYSNEPGGLNESLSDCFGTMFRQWQANQTVGQADWLIGKDILGSAAKAKGYTCLRDMAAPAAKHALGGQIAHFRQYKAGMDPHTSSGVPNLAFCIICKAVGGHSWEKVGKIWYAVMTGSGPKPGLKMKTFANLTRAVAGQLFPGDAALGGAVDAGWKQVGL